MPVLGNYSRGEKRSIVVLDNASIHHSKRVVELIEGAGAYIIYSAPYSPDLNPIEMMFGHYKQTLKRHEGRSQDDAHMAALEGVTPTVARSYFRHSQVPGCEHFPSVEEAERLSDAKAKEFETLCVASIVRKRSAQTATLLCGVTAAVAAAVAKKRRIEV